MEKADLNACALCLGQRALQHSHVLPEFFYAPVYGDNHQYKLIENRAGGVRVGTRQKGLREYLLCWECEQHLGRYEKYAASLLRSVDAAVEKENTDITIPFDAQQFRLFSLSLLWRAGIAKGLMFRSVRLGPHEEPLRQMLQAGDPGEPSTYGFIMGRTSQGDLRHHPVIAPTPNRSGHFRVYRLQALGYLWQFYVDSRLRTIAKEVPFVGSTGELKIPLIGSTQFTWKPNRR